MFVFHVFGEIMLTKKDFADRIEWLRGIKDGWYNGDSLGIDSAGLDWFTNVWQHQIVIWNSLKEDEAHRWIPYMYPTPEGHISVEWSIGMEMIVDLKAQTGLLWFDDDKEDITLDLNKMESWSIIIGNLVELQKACEYKKPKN